MVSVFGILTGMGQFSIRIISYLDYFGLFLLMAMESMVFPVPSELVMPFAGFLIAEGEMSFALVILFSSLGSLFGSLLSYYLGLFGGNKAVLKYGRFFLLDEEDLRKTEQWFSKRGEATVLISRFIPVVRHLISLPAGMGKMNLKKFLAYTVIGATLWNTFLAYMGFLLGQNWELVRQYSEHFSTPLLLIIAILGGYFIYRHIKHKILKRKNNQ